jgi:hypothetical protein
MLRGFVIGLGVLGLVGGVVALVAGTFPPAFVFGFWGLLLVIGTVFERVIYKRIASGRPGPGWQRTTERFVDEATGRVVTVYIEPATGERAYVAD